MSAKKRESKKTVAAHGRGGMSYEAWKALGPERAAAYSAERLGLDEDRQRKLALILAREWGASPNDESIDLRQPGVELERRANRRFAATPGSANVSGARARSGAGGGAEPEKTNP